MTEKQSYKGMFSESDRNKDGEVEIDLMEVFRKIINIRKTLYKAIGVGVVIGVIVSLSIPKEYTVKVTLSPEMGNSKGNTGLAGLAASFLGSAATTGENSDALNVSLSSDIVASTPFLMELLSIKISESNDISKMTLNKYLDEQSSPWWDYVIGVPGAVIGGMKSLFINEDKRKNNKIGKGVIELTEEDDNKINFLKKKIIAVIDNKTAITSVTVTLQEPKVAAIVADSVVHKLQEYIVEYRTSKAKEDCAYLEKLYKERQKEYYCAQKKYANYVDTHDNLILQRVRAEQERLQNDMGIAYQVYSQVANQLQIARAKVQEEKPVFAIVEPAVVPLWPSGLGLKIYVLLFAFLSVILTIGWVLIGKGMWNHLRNMK